jgi:hypothetical protein
MNDVVQFLIQILIGCFLFDCIDCLFRCEMPSWTNYLPDFEGDNSELKKLAFILAIMVFLLGALKIIFNARRE